MSTTTLVFEKNICCGFSVEMPQGGTSNEYPHFNEIRKIFA